MATVTELLARRGIRDVKITPESSFSADLGIDSLELSELSAVLEDEYGHDPFSEGIKVETVGALLAYYRG